MSTGDYGFEDTTQTYAQGGQVSAVAADAGAACQAVANAAEGAATGSSVVQSALQDFEMDVNTARGELMNEIDGLGAATSQTAATGQQAQNEATALQNQGGSLSRTVNAGAHAPIAI